MQVIFPFTAIVGQDTMKTALILNAISPKIGGVLIRGERGTAKSIAARALAALLPEITVVADCPFGCDPARPTTWCTNCRDRVDADEELPTKRRRTRFVDLPVSATEDRVVGTLDIERAIQKGEKRFEPGVLAAANRGVLYVDEVNLLDDHVVDLLLDAAAMGVNVVEREGISFSPVSRKSLSKSSMKSSMVFMLISSFWQARCIPERTFSRLNTSRRPSFFTIMIGISSMCS